VAGAVHGQRARGAEGLWGGGEAMAGGADRRLSGVKDESNMNEYPGQLVGDAPEAEAGLG
jgi:hypothetical protein